MFLQGERKLSGRERQRMPRKMLGGDKQIAHRTNPIEVEFDFQSIEN